jgi:uroporphyrinogen decarboxylase
VVKEAIRILEDAAGKPGHIFNLGHGVLPETDPEVLARVVETVHDWRPGTFSDETAG